MSHDLKMTLVHNGRAVEQAILVLYHQSKFDHTDMATGCYYAGWLNAGKHLTGLDLIKARKVALKYIQELSNLINE